MLPTLFQCQTPPTLNVRSITQDIKPFFTESHLSIHKSLTF